MPQRQTTSLLAYAKINLYLDILSRRENGYHNILSIMQSVALADTVTLTKMPEGSGISVETDLPGLPTDRRNLAYRAAEKFAEILGRVPDVHIRIEKKIPMAAGLAGGSADAAAVLRGLNCLFETRTPIDRLCALGATMGADIPFCIVGGAFIAEGIGEILTPCQALPTEQWLVIACGGEGVSTPDAYRALDEMYADFATPREGGARFAALQDALRDRDVVGVRDHMYNIFEEIVLPTHSTAPKLIAAMKELGAQAVMMSGSGPSVFGLFADECTASRAADVIRDTLGIPAHVTRPTAPNEI